MVQETTYTVIQSRVPGKIAAPRKQLETTLNTTKRCPERQHNSVPEDHNLKRDTIERLAAMRRVFYLSTKPVVLEGVFLKIILITSEKGGSGKTMLAAHVA